MKKGFGGSGFVCGIPLRDCHAVSGCAGCAGGATALDPLTP